MGTTKKKEVAVDVGGLTRWHHNEFSQEMHTDPIGEYVKFSDVRALLPTKAAAEATPAANEREAERAMASDDGEPVADLEHFINGSIRDFPDFREDVERLSAPGLGKKQAKVIRKEIYDTIDQRVRNAVKATRAAHPAEAAQSAPEQVVPEEVCSAVERMCTPLHESRLGGATAEADARCMATIKQFIDSLGAVQADSATSVPRVGGKEPESPYNAPAGVVPRHFDDTVRQAYYVPNGHGGYTLADPQPRLEAVVTSVPRVASIDTPEFNELLSDFGYDYGYGDEKQAAGRAKIIAHIDAHIARQAQAAPAEVCKAALEEAAKVCDRKYEARVESSHPREASAARSLAADIRALRATSTPADDSQKGGA